MADGYAVRIPHSTAVVAAACLLANAFGVLSGRIKTKKRLDHPSHKAPAGLAERGGYSETADQAFEAFGLSSGWLLVVASAVLSRNIAALIR
ncbi:MAG: hypothetical protein DMF03_07025 [Verrucomicrobia bacterium]|nr:MAG: hypothetical protein DMF03_07025 [Verrucomicrobiota bacterium]